MPRYPSQTCSRVSKRKLVFQTYLSGSTVIGDFQLGRMLRFDPAGQDGYVLDCTLLGADFQRSDGGFPSLYTSFSSSGPLG